MSLSHILLLSVASLGARNPGMHTTHRMLALVMFMGFATFYVDKTSQDKTDR